MIKVWLLFELLAEQPHGAHRSLRHGDPCSPAKGGKAAYIQLFLGGPDGFSGVPIEHLV